MNATLKEFSNHYALTWSKSLVDIFHENKIFLSYPWKIEGTYQDGAIIRIAKAGTIEPFACHPRNRILDFGAFSFSKTPNMDLDLKVGRYCSIETGVELLAHNPPLDRISTHPFTTHPDLRKLAREEFNRDTTLTAHRFNPPAPKVGHDVFIGKNAALRRGVSIGNGAIIHPYSVVQEDVPPFAIVSGSPARIIGYRFDSDELRDRISSVAWWQYNFSDLPQLDPRGIESFLSDIETRTKSGDLQKFEPQRIDIVEVLKESGLVEYIAIEKKERTARPTPRGPKKESLAPYEGQRTFHSFMLDRVEGRESNLPLFLIDKLKCYNFLSDRGFPTASIIANWNDPAKISLSQLPNEFVLKPTMESSTRGVMVLKKFNGMYYESMKRQYLTEDDIIRIQKDFFERISAKDNRIIAEEKIYDSEDFTIPRDFKAYCFKGRIALILMVNRNTKPSSVCWFDQDFNLIKDGRVTSNPRFANLVDSPKPRHFEALLEVARDVSISLPTPFARVDMFSTPNGPIVGEVTLSPGGVYYELHHQLSRPQQALMGAMWDEALTKMS